MTEKGRRYIIEVLGRQDHRNGRDSRNNRDNRDNRDMIDAYDEEDMFDEADERRGVKGSGRGRRKSNRMDRNDMEDSRDFNDFADHGEHRMKLSKADKNRWKREMENTDGTTGPHFDMQQVMHAAEKLGVKFNEYSETDFCLVTNMMYSDYGHVIKKLVSPEKEVIVCADLAKAYFDDPDGLEPEEKLAVHYHCMTNLG